MYRSGKCISVWDKRNKSENSTTANNSIHCTHVRHMLAHACLDVRQKKVRGAERGHRGEGNMAADHTHPLRAGQAMVSLLQLREREREGEEEFTETNKSYPVPFSSVLQDSFSL